MAVSKVRPQFFKAPNLAVVIDIVRLLKHTVIDVALKLTAPEVTQTSNYQALNTGRRVALKDQVRVFVAEIMPAGVLVISFPKLHLGEVIDVEELQGVYEGRFPTIIGGRKVNRLAKVELGKQVIAAVDRNKLLNAVMHRQPTSGAWAASTG